MKFLFISLLLFSITQSFSQSTDKAPVKKQDSIQDNDKVYKFGEVSVNARFEKDQSSLVNYLSKNLRYPTIALKNNWEGTVYISFIIEKNGDLKHIKIIRGCSYENINKEAIRLIDNMPKWNSAVTSDGIKVRQIMTMPIRFKIID